MHILSLLKQLTFGFVCLCLVDTQHITTAAATNALSQRRLQQQQQDRRQWLGGEIYTREEVKYGRFEARLRISDVSGTLTTMFWYHEGSERPCDTMQTDCMGQTQKQCWQELDVEIMGRDRGLKVSTNAIMLHAQDREMFEQNLDTPDADSANQWAVYSMDWEPERFVWKVNGQTIRIDDQCHGPSLFTETMGMRLNFWSCQDALAGWCGPFDNMPAVAAYDWVKYYSFDPLTDAYSLIWTDNFDAFDDGRWGIADWTFGENRVQFSPSQVVIVNGILFMVIDDKETDMQQQLPVRVQEIANSSNQP